MSENKIATSLFKRMNSMLNEMKNNPEKVTEEDRNNLSKLYSLICKTLGISEHSRWEVQWRVEKWADTAKKLAGFAPDEVCTETQNIILDTGANEMLKLIAGTGGTAFSNANAYIFVGTDTTPENASQTSVIASGGNRAYAKMDSGYPSVSGRQVIYRSSFGDEAANFAWNEAAITNGSGVGAIAMNRKVASLGTKATGTWTIQITVSLVSA